MIGNVRAGVALAFVGFVVVGCGSSSSSTKSNAPTATTTAAAAPSTTTASGSAATAGATGSPSEVALDYAHAVGAGNYARACADMFPAIAQRTAQQSPSGGCPAALKETLESLESKHEPVWYRADYAGATVSKKGSASSTETEVELRPPSSSSNSPIALKMIHSGGPWQVAEAGFGPESG